MPPGERAGERQSESGAVMSGSGATRRRGARPEGERGRKSRITQSASVSSGEIRDLARSLRSFLSSAPLRRCAKRSRDAGGELGRRRDAPAAAVASFPNRQPILPQAWMSASASVRSWIFVVAMRHVIVS